MKKKGSSLILLAALLIVAMPFAAHAEDQVVVKTQQDRANYMTGVEFVRELQKKGGTINLNVVIKGMEDELTGKTMPMADDQAPAASAPEAVQIAADPAAAGKTEHQAVRLGAEAPSDRKASQTSQTALAQRHDGYAAPERMRAQDGTLLSRTNQARLNILQMKQEMRLKAMAGQL